MADFFDKLKQGIGKGVTTVGIKSKEMLDTNRVTSQITDFERQKKDALAALGTAVCAMLDSGNLDEDALRSARLAVAQFDEQINEKRQEIAQIHSEAEQALGTAQHATGSSQVSHCTSCGAAVAAGTKFCGGCGSKI